MLVSQISRVILRNSLQTCLRNYNRSYANDFGRREYQLSIFGNREQVGYGTNGEPAYQDRSDFPFPSIRYKEPTPEIQALRGKERGDWRLLTLDEKKRLYRASFCQTFVEFQAPTGEWKSCISWTLFWICAAVWIYIMEVIYVYDDYPESFSITNRKAQLRRQIDLHMEPITGLSSNWDYEKMEWKKQYSFFPLPNPFKNECGEVMPVPPYK